MTRDSKVVVVTGAASGMGRTAAVRWAQQGHRVAAVDFSREGLERLVASNPQIESFECDVTDAAAVRRTADNVTERLGSPDRLLSAAGICPAGRIGEMPIADVHRTMAVNYFGAVHWVDAVLPAMRSRGGGEIILFSSIGGFLPAPGVDAYVASKFAVLGLAEVLRKPAERDGIRVICVCPPPVETPMLDAIMAGTPAAPGIARFMKPMRPEAVIGAIEDALDSRRFLVLPNAVAKASYVMRRLAPNLTSTIVHRVMDPKR